MRLSSAAPVPTLSPCSRLSFTLGLPHGGVPVSLALIPLSPMSGTAKDTRRVPVGSRAAPDPVGRMKQGCPEVRGELERALCKTMWESARIYQFGVSTEHFRPLSSALQSWGDW